MIPFIARCIFFAAVIFLVGHTPGIAEGDKGIAFPQPSHQQGIVYVSDFLIDVDEGDNTKDQKLPVRKKLRGIVDMTGLTREETPREKAQKIVHVLAGSIVEELNKKGVISLRLFAHPPPYSDCFLLDGEFLEHSEGDRLKRAVIGFGTGSAEMVVQMMFSEIRDGTTHFLMDTATVNKKNHMPGAVVSMNPYVAGAKFVLTKNAPERDSKKMGSRIAGAIYEYMLKQGLIPQQEDR